MKIVVVCGACYISGKEKIMLSILSGLKEKGHEVFCIMSNWNNGTFISKLNENDISYKEMRIGFISKTFNWRAIRMTLHQILYYPALLWNYFRFTKSFKPDVVIHSNFHHLFLLYPVISKKYHNIYHSHESINNSSFYQKLFSFFSRKVDLFVGVSYFVTKRMSDLGVRLKKTKTIHNGLSSIDITNRYQSRKNEEVIKIGIVGQIGEWKGHLDLLKAIALLKKNHSEHKVKLFIYGTGDNNYIEVLKNIISEYKLNESVLFEGFVGDMKKIYSNLHLVIIPSRSEEPFATSALEPGLFALPVIVSNRGGLPEIVEDGINGFVFNMGDIEGLSNAILQFIEVPERLEKMGKAHFEKVSSQFSFLEFIDNWELTIKQLNRN